MEKLKIVGVKAKNKRCLMCKRLFKGVEHRYLIKYGFFEKFVCGECFNKHKIKEVK